MNNLFLNLPLLLVITLLLSCDDKFRESHNIMRDYELKGRFLIINNCSKKSSDIPNILRFDIDLTYKKGEARHLVVKDQETHQMKSNKYRSSKFSYFRFGVTTGKFADRWIIKGINSKNNKDICRSIKTPSSVCENKGKSSWEFPAVENDMSPFIVNKDIEIICGLKETIIK